MGGFNSKSKRKTSFRPKSEELMPRPKSEERMPREVLTEKILLHISKKIGAEWRLLCVSLGVSRPEIDHINYDTTLHWQTNVYKGLLCWLRLREDTAESELTEELWEAMIENGRQDLVDHIEDYLKEMETTAKGSEIKDDIKIGTEDDEGSTVLYSISAEDSSVLHKQDEDSEVKELRERLIKLNCIQTQNYPVSPLHKTSTVLLEEIFAPVSIREDLEYHGQDRNIGTKEDRRTKSVNHPNEMFYVDGDMAQNIFMLGNAGIGKSVYCLKLVENWCKAKGKTIEDENLNSWVEAMKNFDFLFFAQLRHVNKSRTSVSDMICNDLFKHHPECNDVIRRVISDVRYRCLIIMDGLDEWKISDEAKQKLTVQGLPNTEGMANCTFLWSMRHWVMDKFSNLILSNDRVIELQGLDTYSINTVIKNLLANFYKLDEKSPQYKEKFKEITEKSRDSKLKSIIQMPLMAIACVQIWYEENDVGNSMTSLFVALLDLLIKRSNSKSPLPSNTQEKLVSEPSGIHVTHYPNQFMKKKRVNEIMSVIIKLGKIAYDDLISDETNLVFAVEDLEEYLEDDELEFALNTGILSKCEAPGSSNDENVSVNFFHKSIQEFLAAVYIEYSGEMNAFYEHLTTVEIIMEFDNVLIFLSGLNPSLGCNMSKHIVNVANAGTEVCKLRIFLDARVPFGNTIELLYNLQSICYREIKSGQYSRDSTDQAMSYHVSDVYVDEHSDMETKRTTADILTYHNADIKSLFLCGVSTDIENGIPNSLLTHFLDHTVSLRSLYIEGSYAHRTLLKISDIFSSLTSLSLFSVTLSPEAINALQSALQSNTVIETLGLRVIYSQVNEDQGRQRASLRGLLQILPDLPRLSVLRIRNVSGDKPILADVLSRINNLHGIEIFASYPRDDEFDHGIIQILCKWSQLHWLYLLFYSFGDNGLHLSRVMTNLKKVKLYYVTMSSTGWRNFIKSVLSVQHEFDVYLIGVEIDEKFVATIRWSPEFKMKYNKMINRRSRALKFTRKWQGSQEC